MVASSASASSQPRSAAPERMCASSAPSCIGPTHIGPLSVGDTSACSSAFGPGRPPPGAAAADGRRAAASSSLCDGTSHSSPLRGQRATCARSAYAAAGGRFAATSRIMTRKLDEGLWKKQKAGAACRWRAAASRNDAPASSRSPASLHAGNLCAEAAYPAAAW